MNILENIIFPLGDRLTGNSFTKQLNYHRKLNKLTYEELECLQLTKLKTILIHATKTCSAYRNYYSDSNTLSPINWLKNFPILSKQVLSEQPDDYISSLYNKSSLLQLETSGSSGYRVKIYLTKKEQSILRAILICWWEWTGYYLGKPIFQTGMNVNRGIFKSLKDLLTNTHYFPAFNFDDNTALSFLNKIKCKKNLHLGGYASSLYVLANISEEYKLNIKFDAAISWGDKLFDHYKSKIEDVFHTKVYENYGCNEGLMIGQKVDLDYFYIYTPNVFVEILDDNNEPVQDGDIGHVIVTKLDGFAMPLIRYDTGDLAVMLPKEEYPKSKKFNFPLLKKVIGRNTDIIVTPEGKRLIVHTFTGIFEFYKEIKQFRVIQDDISYIIIEYIPSNSFYHTILDKIEHEFYTKTSSTIQIKWKMVLSITSTASGKPQIIENRLVKKSLVDNK